MREQFHDEARLLAARQCPGRTAKQNVLPIGFLAIEVIVHGHRQRLAADPAGNAQPLQDPEFLSVPKLNLPIQADLRFALEVHPRGPPTHRPHIPVIDQEFNTAIVRILLADLPCN